MNKLIILAPNDRYNYGDLIFSHIIRYYFADEYDGFVNIATVENDLSSVGGEKVLSLSMLNNLTDGNQYDLIVAGGESLCSNWGVCISYLSSKYDFLRIVDKLLRKLLDPMLVVAINNRIGRFLFKGKTYYPYTIGKIEGLNIRKVYYNSLGGASLKDSIFDKKTIEILKSVDYISVRDQNSSFLLNKNGINNILCPDCAILMSEIFTFDFLRQKISSNVDAYVAEHPRYMIFQINKNIGLRNLDEIVDMLNKIYNNYSYQICLCPVGFALGHDDPVALKAIYEKINSHYVRYISDISIWDIMYLIASSQLFMGSSLHGVITSMSYNTPYIGVKVKKTIDYINEWDKLGVCLSSFDFDEFVNHYSKCKINIDSANFQKKTVKMSFELMKKVMRCN